MIGFVLSVVTELALHNPLPLAFALVVGFAIGRVRSLDWRASLTLGVTVVVVGSLGLFAVYSFLATQQPAAALIWVLGIVMIAGSGLIVGAIARVRRIESTSLIRLRQRRR